MSHRNQSGKLVQAAANLVRVTPVLFLAWTLHGCASPEHGSLAGEQARTPLFDRAASDPAVTRPVPEVPAVAAETPRVAVAETPTEAIPAPRPPLPTLPVRQLIMTREAEIGTVLRAMARGAELNLILGPGVSGPVMLSLSGETPWNRLFEMLLDTHGLHYELQDGLLRVMGREDVERATAMERSLRERELAREERRRAEPPSLELYRARYADVKALAEAIKNGFDATIAEDRRHLSIVPDTDSGLLIIQASAASMPQVLRLAESLDQPVYQILIEASIVQTSSDTARDLGMQWGANFRALDQGRVELGTGINPDGFNLNFPANFGPGEPGFSFGGIRDSGNQILQMQLSALEKDGRLNIISNPSITTLDRQTALIESGEERPFQSAQGTGAGTTSVVEFKKALLSLEVTPQVIDGNWVKLHIKTTKDDFDDSRQVIIEGTLQVPIITRSATTTLYLADGQTTVIGGLSTTSRFNQRTGLPILKDLPGLGRLFGSTNDSDSFSDTLIFLTPRILVNGSSVRPSPQDTSP